MKRSVEDVLRPFDVVRAEHWTAVVEAKSGQMWVHFERKWADDRTIGSTR